MSWTLRPPLGAAHGPGAEAVSEAQYLMVSGRDVTGQRQAEQALLTSETRYKHVVENKPGLRLHLYAGRLPDLAEYLPPRASAIAWKT